MRLTVSCSNNRKRDLHHQYCACCYLKVKASHLYLIQLIVCHNEKDTNKKMIIIARVIFVFPTYSKSFDYVSGIVELASSLDFQFLCAVRQLC